MNLSHRPGTAIIFCIVLADATHAQDDWSNTRDSFICRSSTEVREIKTYVSENTLSCRVDLHQERHNPDHLVVAYRPIVLRWQSFQSGRKARSR